MRSLYVRDKFKRPQEGTMQQSSNLDSLCNIHAGKTTHVEYYLSCRQNNISKT